MASYATEHEKVLRISPPDKTARKVLVAGHHSLAGSLMADALMHNLGLDATVINPSELLRTLGRSEIGLLIMSADLDSTPGTGFDLASAVSRAYPRIPIVVTIDKPSYELVVQAFRSGARGVFDHRESMSDFLDCVEHVRKGYIWAGKEGTDALMEALRRLPAPSGITGDDLSALTMRELQVVQCAARGKTNKAIASELHLSEHTVKNYIFRAFEKLHVSSRVELLFYLATRGHPFGPPEARFDEPAAK